MSHHNALQDIAIEAGKAAPPVAVAGAHYVFGLSLADWVAIATLLYLAAQFGLLIPKYRAQFSNWRKGRRGPQGSKNGWLLRHSVPLWPWPRRW